MTIGTGQRMSTFNTAFDMDASNLAQPVNDGANRFEFRYGFGFTDGLSVKFAQNAITVYWNGIEVLAQPTALSARGTDHAVINVDAVGNFNVSLTGYGTGSGNAPLTVTGTIPTSSWTSQAMTNYKFSFFGDKSITPASSAWIDNLAITATVDSTVVLPTPHITSVIDNVGASTGALVSGVITDDKQPTLSGIATNATSVKVYDGDFYLGSAIVHTATGVWTFTPTYEISGGTRTLNVRAVNAGNIGEAESFILTTLSTPVNTVPAAQTAASNTAYAITGVSVVDADNNLTTTQLTVLNGAVTVTLSGGATISAGANGSTTLTLSGTQTQINDALATLRYQSNAGYLGADTLTVTSTDGSSLIDSDTVAISVVDSTPPTLISSMPSDGGYVIAVGNNLTLTFSEAVVKGTGLIQLYNASNTLVESFDVASSALVTGWNGSTLTINPTNNLTASTGYYLKIASTAIKDTAGNAYAGINDTTTLNFSTPASDGSVSADPLYGAYAENYLGSSISSAGDVNGDGFDDFIVSASGTNSAYVIYGSAGGLGAYVDASSIAATKGFKMTGGLSSGYTVSGAGDVNGDGYADMLVGAFYGGAYVVYGGSAMGNNVVLTDLTANNGGFTIGYINNRVVNAGGDVNGDGLADFILSGYTDAYVVYGRIGRTNLDLSSGITPSDGFAVNFGRTVASAGDVNGDGFSDLIVGHSDIRSAFVVYGNSTGTSVYLNSSTIAQGSGFKIYSAQVTNFGYYVSSAGDVNGDGLADVMMYNGTSTYVVYGKTTSATVNIDSAGDILVADGFKVSITSGQIGSSMTAAGDINGDGFADVLIGSAVSSIGTAYVVYGGSAIPNTVNVDSTSFTATNGFKITGEIYYRTFASSVSSAGDINGDGLGDLIFGVNSQHTGYQGGYKILLGGTQWLSNAISLRGTTAAEAVLGTTGDDTLTGGGGVDRFFAGKGNDTIVLTASDITNLANNASAQTAKAQVMGGTGFDTIRLSGGAALNFSTISNAGAMGLEENSRIESIERIDLATDTGANALTITAKDIKDMAGLNLFHTGSASADGKIWTNVTGTTLSATTKFHQMLIDGDSNDSVVLNTHMGTWSNAGTVSDGTTNYVVYQNSATTSQVLVKSGVSVVSTGAPVLLTESPSDNGYMMALTNNITLTFDQAVIKGTGTIQLWNKITGALVESFDVASSSLVTGWTGNTLTINPTANLTASSSYFIKISDTAIQNAAGSTFAGIFDATTYNFTTLGTDNSYYLGPGNFVPYNTGLVGVTSAGDFNGDGFDDYLVNAGTTNSAYLIYGDAIGIGTDVSVGSIAPSSGFKIVAGGAMWTSGAGDFNGDGLSDLLVGWGGSTFVIYGNSNAIASGVNLSSGPIASSVMSTAMVLPI
jgi:methionine-rich copper-binding protein CopC